MNSTGLTSEQLNVLTQIFRKHAEVKAAKLYGSRAKGNFHPRSDIDLVIFGDNIDRFLISDILLDLDDSNLPYSVDLQNYSDLKNRALIEHTDRVGVPIYRANNANRPGFIKPYSSQIQQQASS